MIVREAVRSDLDVVIALLHEDAIRQIDESEVAPPAYSEAFVAGGSVAS